MFFESRRLTVPALFVQEGIFFLSGEPEKTLDHSLPVEYSEFVVSFN
jgi:hypothetical protein